MVLYQALSNLTEDIQKASDEPNFEKANNYSSHFSELLLLIFGIENQSEPRYLLLFLLFIYHKLYILCDRVIYVSFDFHSHYLYIYIYIYIYNKLIFH